MTKPAAPAAAHAYVEERRARILAAIGRDPRTAGSGAEPLSAERLAFCRREAEDLYWNELSWEELTDEEAISGGHMTEMVFPGFLAFVEGLLVDKVPADALSPARPHPDAVQEILAFLGERYAEARQELQAGADSQKVVYARVMTSQLIDLVLYRFYGLSGAEVEMLEAKA